MAKKRGNSEGSIYHMKDGRWRAAIVTGSKVDGSFKRKVFTGRTRHEVANALKIALRDLQRGINIDPEKKTVSHFLTNWLESIKRDVAPATYISYEGAVRIHLNPFLGHLLLSKLTASHVQEFKQAKLKEIRSNGPGVKKPSNDEARVQRYLSGKTVGYYLKVLRMALEEAYKLDLVPRNVARLVDFPKAETAEITPYTLDQAQQFIEAAKSHRLGCLFSAALALGLRKGEALALRWPAIDLEAGTLSVRLTLQRIKMPGEAKGRLILKEPKRSSHRVLNLPKAILSELAAHQRRQAEDRASAGTRWQEGEFVFTSTIGTPLEPRNLGRAYSDILLAAGLPRVRIHDLRHTAATLLLVQGVHPRVVQELLGHSSIAITMNTYSHVVPSLCKQAAEQMDAALKGTNAVLTALLPNRVWGKPINP